MYSHEQAYAGYPQHQAVHGKYDMVQTVGLDDPTQVEGEGKALITYQMLSCLGATAASPSEKVARMLHVNTADQPLQRMGDLKEFLFEANRDLDNPDVRIVSPCFVNNSMMGLIREVRKQIEAATANIRNKQLSFLDPNHCVNFIAVGTDGGYTLDTTELDTETKLRALLVHELGFTIAERRMPVNPMAVNAFVQRIPDIATLERLVNNPDEKLKETAYLQILMTLM